MGLQDPVSLGALSMGVAAILVIWLYMRRKTKVDEYRETLFTLRDELFDYMWQHNLPFDLPEYRRLREQLNQGIQVAAEVAPLSFLVAGLAVAVWGVSSNTPEPPPSTALDEAHRQQFRRTDDASLKALMVFIGPTAYVMRFLVRRSRQRKASKGPRKNTS